MREEVTKISIRDFYFYFNDNDFTDKSNSQDKKFFKKLLNKFKKGCPIIKYL